MWGGTVGECTTLVHRVQVMTCTSQHCCGHYIVRNCPHDLCQAVEDTVDLCQAPEVPLDVVWVAVADEVRKD